MKIRIKSRGQRQQQHGDQIPVGSEKTEDKARSGATFRDRTKPSNGTPAVEKSRRGVKIERRIKCSRRRRGTLREIHRKEDMN
jgi:hypothetical protein